MYHLLSDKLNQWKYKPPRDSMINPKAYPKCLSLNPEGVFPLILICLSVNDFPFYKAERELTDLKLEFVNFVYKKFAHF